MERKDWILSVLYSSGKTKEICEPVNGSLRLMKILFIIGQENKNLPNFYNSWKRYLYGPCDFDVYEDLFNLKDDGLIEEKERKFQSFTMFTLTTKGKEKIEPIFSSLSLDVKKLIIDTKHLANSRQSLKNLLEYVYSKYPGWDTQSIFKLY